MLLEDENFGNVGNGSFILGIVMFVMFLLLKMLNFYFDYTNFNGFFYLIGFYSNSEEDDELISSNPGFHLYWLRGL